MGFKDLFKKKEVKISEGTRLMRLEHNVSVALRKYTQELIKSKINEKGIKTDRNVCIYFVNESDKKKLEPTIEVAFGNKNQEIYGVWLNGDENTPNIQWNDRLNRTTPYYKSNVMTIKSYEYLIDSVDSIVDRIAKEVELRNEARTVIEKSMNEIVKKYDLVIIDQFKGE